MNWDAIGAIGENIGALAVVVSLIYLATQVRTSNRLARSEAFRTPNSDLVALNATFSTNNDFRKAVIMAAQGQELDPERKLILDSYYISFTNLYEQIFREIREGIIEEKMFMEFGGRDLIAGPYYRTNWPRYKRAMSPEFAAYFEEKFSLLDNAHRN